MKRNTRRFPGGPVPAHLFLGPAAVLLFARSLTVSPPRPSIWLLVFLWGPVLLLFGALKWLTGNRATSSAVVAIVVIAFFLDFGVTLWPPVSLAMWITVAAISGVLILRRSEARGMTTFANLMFLSFVLLFCLQLAFAGGTSILAVKADRPSVAPINNGHIEQPDIYLIVLDSYPRADVLNRLFHYRDPFVESLRQEGFYVANNATSNYAQTALSVASSLNLDYLPALVDGVPSDAVSRAACQALISDNRVFRTLRDAGYRIVTFASEYSMLTFPNADRQYAPLVYLTDFSTVFLRSGIPTVSRLLGLPPAFLPHQIRRHHIEWTLEELSSDTLTTPARPTLVFAHILLPHPPFVFRADGSYTRTGALAGINDGDHWGALQTSTGDTYAGGYTEQLRFVADRLTPIVHSILAGARRPAVVIIMGDHGSGLRLIWEDSSKSDLNERMSILLAIKFSRSAHSLYPTITPVNVMRLLLNDALGTEMKLLDDRAWFSTWSRPYRFVDATDRARSVAP